MQPAEILLARRNADGAFGPVPGAASEPEPTALAALALGDGDTVDWLADAQAEDGSVGAQAGSVYRDVTALAGLAMRDPRAQGRALAWVLGSQARAEPSSDALPHDPDLRGWSWTSDTFAWTEPTAWAVLALRVFGQDGPELDDGIATLRDRECVGGGWNYGNRIVLDEELPPFVQTTGIALLALAGLDDPVVTRGVERLAALWRDERDGILSLAVAAAALRRLDHDAAAEVAAALDASLDARSDVDTIALAWATIALGDGLDRLVVA